MLRSTKTVDGTPVKKLSPGSEKKVELICDLCGVVSLAIFHNYTISQAKRADDGKTFCRSCASKMSGEAKRGKPIKKTGPRPNVHAEKHASWRGGRFISSDGYVQIYIGPRSYRKEHFIVMEQSLGRALESGEIVHHIDGDKQNNDIENLVLLHDESEHRKAHNSLYEASCLLIGRGIIRYNKTENSYEITSNQGE